MIRWLKIARAELIRDVTTSLRYPLQLLTGLFIIYVLFMGLYMGARAIAGKFALSGDLDGVIIGYTMWFFALMAINTMSIDIENEAMSHADVFEAAAIAMAHPRWGERPLRWTKQYRPPFRPVTTPWSSRAAATTRTPPWTRRTPRSWCCRLRCPRRIAR